MPEIEDFESEDTEAFLLSCDICGQEEDEDEAEENWIAFVAPHLEVLVCTECAGLKENLDKGFRIFLENLLLLGIGRRETMT
jgi:hypothetical protein